MHADEVEIDDGLARRLVSSRFPRWADLPLRRVSSAGTDHAIFRLGDDLSVRLPRIGWASGQAEKEHRWLPRLAPRVPVEVPAPIELCAPTDEYPFPWCVAPWLPGETAELDRIDDVRRLAADLARFVTCLHAIDTEGGPRPGEMGFSRGEPPAERDRETRASIEAAAGLIDVDATTAAWDAALAVPPWSGPGVWVHGDLLPGNLLVVDDRLSAVIDWGGLAVGDPAADLMTAWSTLPPAARRVFRDGVEVDDDTWERARGWAISFGAMALPYYQRTNPTLAAIARRAIDEALTDRR